MGDEGERKREREGKRISGNFAAAVGRYLRNSKSKSQHPPAGEIQYSGILNENFRHILFLPRIFFIFCRVLNLRNCLRLLCYMPPPGPPPTHPGRVDAFDFEREDDSLGQKRKKVCHSSGQGKKVRVSPKLHVDFANLKNNSCQKKVNSLFYDNFIFFFLGGG